MQPNVILCITLVRAGSYSHSILCEYFSRILLLWHSLLIKAASQIHSHF